MNFQASFPLRDCLNRERVEHRGDDGFLFCARSGDSIYYGDYGKLYLHLGLAVM